MTWYIAVLKQYASSSGRSRRQEYWMFTLINTLVVIGILIVQGILGFKFPVLSFAYALAVLCPHINVAIRRLHDTNRSGWWLLIGIIPIIGAIVLLVFTVQDSQPGNNRFGPNPKETQAA